MHVRVLLGPPKNKGVKMKKDICDICTDKLKKMYTIKKGCDHGPAPIPEEGDWIKVKDITQISALSHGIGWCAPQQGACKLTLNVKNGIIKEALIETIGCSGMTHSAAMAAEILQNKTIIEALNTDLVCDAINVAMREIFKQLIYGRSQTAFSKNGLPIGSSLEDLGNVMRSQIGTMIGSVKTGVRYLEMTDGYVLKLGLDKNNEIIGYQFLNLGKMMQNIREGIDYKIAYEKAIGIYGRYKEAVKYIDPRKE